MQELWSLFDFLMPGLLGSERQFNARYGRMLQVGRVLSVNGMGFAWQQGEGPVGRGSRDWGEQDGECQMRLGGG